MGKVLLVAGCSHSCGNEISGPLTYRCPENLDLCFGGRIARGIGYQHLNVAVGGNSNEIIAATVVHHVNKLLVDHLPEDVLVLVGWTSFTRTHVIVGDRVIKFSPKINRSPWWDSYPEPAKRYFDAWIRVIGQDEGHNAHARNYTLVSSFLRSRGVRYVFFNAISAVERPTRNPCHEVGDLEIDEISFGNMETDPFYLSPFAWEMTYDSHSRARFDPRKDGRHGHFAEEAHEEWARVLMPLIEARLATDCGHPPPRS